MRRVGRDRRGFFSFGNYRVSIHALARGATLYVDDFVNILKVSIHAPARGATMAFSYFRGQAESFNSRARKGRDSIWFYLSIFLCLQRFFCEIQKIFISYIAYFILFFATCLILICAKSLAFFAHL